MSTHWSRDDGRRVVIVPEVAPASLREHVGVYAIAFLISIAFWAPVVWLIATAL
jgi:predicted phage tail protein